jgi:hypothetical protein
MPIRRTCPVSLALYQTTGALTCSRGEVVLRRRIARPSRVATRALARWRLRRHPSAEGWLSPKATLMAKPSSCVCRREHCAGRDQRMVRNLTGMRDARQFVRITSPASGLRLRLPRAGEVRRSGNAPARPGRRCSNRRGGEATKKPRRNLRLTRGAGGINQEQTSGMPECGRSSRSGAT